MMDNGRVTQPRIIEEFGAIEDRIADNVPIDLNYSIGTALTIFSIKSRSSVVGSVGRDLSR
jgi:hypothetical protein